jgi:hypothetical protein
MPRLPALRTRVLQELAKHLRFESPEAARRQLARAEELAAQLLAESAEGAGAPEAYPEEWVVFRITGLRAEAGNGVVVREALLGDLPALVDRLSSAAELRVGDLKPSGNRASKARTTGRTASTAAAVSSDSSSSWLDVEGLCRRWKVSRKTLDRYRRLGLVSRRVSLGRGRERVVYSEECVRAFERVHRARVDGAGAFSRIDARRVERIVAHAARYHRRFGWSLHRCAQRIAAREGRSVETIRLLLRRHDQRAARPVFDAPGPLDGEQSAWIERSARRGGNLSGAAARVRKGRSTVYRVVGDRRAGRLRELDLRGPVGATFERKDAEEVFLLHAAARTGLGEPGPSSIGALVRLAAGIEPSAAAQESARAGAYWYLLWWCSRAIGALPRHGARVGAAASGAGLDVIETRLLWASRLKAEMVRAELPLMLRTIEAQTERRLSAMPAAVLVELIGLGIESLIESVDRFDPFKGGRQAAPVGIGLTRALSQWLRGNRERLGAPGRAAARVDMDQLPLEDFTRRVHPWQAWLEPPIEVRAGVLRPVAAQSSGEPAAHGALLAMRYGWNGAPPLTLERTGEALGLRPTRVSAIQRNMVAQLGYGAGEPAKRKKRA